jgi:large subunit ribosomal protein L4
MKSDVFNLEGKKIHSVDLPDYIFAAKINVDLMHQAYVRQMANARLGTHKTKSRGEVRGGGKKPWRQKGTGRARVGSIRSPIWVGGGKVHTPRPRSYEKRMPRKMRRAALRSALSVKAAGEAIIFIEDLDLPDAKTKVMAEVLERLAGNASVLVLVPEKNEAYDTVARSINNLTNAKLLLASYLNIRDLLSYDKLLVPVDALEVIKSYLGAGGGTS